MTEGRSFLTNDTPRDAIFLAFANELDDRVQYLSELPQEARQLAEILVDDETICEVVVRSNTIPGRVPQPQVSGPHRHLPLRRPRQWL
jgi:hypothetical protein